MGQGHAKCVCVIVYVIVYVCVGMGHGHANGPWPWTNPKGSFRIRKGRVSRRKGSQEGLINQLSNRLLIN